MDPESIRIRAPKNLKIPSFPLKKILRVLLILFILFVIKSAFVFVPPGNVGAVYDLGRGVVPRTLNEGLSLVIPFWQQVHLFDTRLQEYTMAKVTDEGAIRRDDSLDAPTSDGQQVNVDATILFRVEQDKVPDLWRTVGTDYIDKLVRPITRSQIRMVISRYNAQAIYSEKRQEAETVMTKEVSDILKEKHVIVDRILLRAVYFSPEYSQAIENKVIAEQRVKQAEFEVKETEQRAKAKIEEAQGLAEAQNLQKASLTQEYLQLEAIKKWDGKLPQYTGTGNAPFLNLPLR